eukprot:8977951-Pyramimonas_sp.AAC.1
MLARLGEAEATNQLLLLVSALVPKALASILTSLVHALAQQGYVAAPRAQRLVAPTQEFTAYLLISPGKLKLHRSAPADWWFQRVDDHARGGICESLVGELNSPVGRGCRGGAAALPQRPRPFDFLPAPTDGLTHTSMWQGGGATALPQRPRPPGSLPTGGGADVAAVLRGL